MIRLWNTNGPAYCSSPCAAFQPEPGQCKPRERSLSDRRHQFPRHALSKVHVTEKADPISRAMVLHDECVPTAYVSVDKSNVALIPLSLHVIRMISDATLHSKSLVQPALQPSHDGREVTIGSKRSRSNPRLVMGSEQFSGYILKRDEASPDSSTADAAYPFRKVCIA